MTFQSRPLLTWSIISTYIVLNLPTASLANSLLDIRHKYDSPVSIALNFVYHIDMDMAEQDVFIERQKGSGIVFRATKADRDMNAPLYFPAKPVEHSPFDPNDVGPYRKGKAMGMTLGDWFKGKGSGKYTCSNGKGTIKMNFSKLRPNAVYTMWHFFFANPPTKPSIGTYDIPMGTRDGAQSVFHTDDQGNAVFEKTITPCLQLSGEHIASGLAISWHSDGKTYGPLPGVFSMNSHVQLFTVLPKRSGI